jgi:succinate dehydrogenase/fumarate reductase cytochrome b subunit
MDQSNRSEPIVTKMDSVELKTSPSLGTLGKDIILSIFKRLDMCHIVAMVMACKYFKSIWESVSELDMCIYTIVLDAAASWKLLHHFKYPLKYVLQDLNLGPWLKFKPVIQGSKIGTSSECSTKALFWVQKGCVRNDTLKLLPSYQELEISSQELEKSSQELEKLKSLEYLCIRGGCLLKDWPKFFDQFPKLRCIYFRPSGLHYTRTTWTVNTQRTFIMDHACIQIKSGTIE